MIAPPVFVDLHRVVPAIQVEMRYAGAHNFVGRRVHGYRQPICIVTRPAARALARAERVLHKRGDTLRVYDCYRPQRAVDDFVRWAADLGDQSTKAEFYPDVDKSQLFADGYIAAKSGHSRGSTIDLTIVRTATDTPLAMGTPFDFFDPRSNTLDPRITGRAHADRLLLKRTMSRAGFENYAKEWWHYTLRGEPYPTRRFDFPVARSSLHH